MSDKRTTIYWDACTFLSYINEIPSRVATLSSLLDSSADPSGSIKLYTSSLSHVEVSFAATEQQKRTLDPQQEQRINKLWDGSSVMSVEFHQSISRLASSLIRGSLTRGWRLKPADAIHLATAEWLSNTGLSVSEFHTYDGRLKKFEQILTFRIVEPYTARPKMI